MDFSSRSTQQSPAAPRPGNSFGDEGGRKGGKSSKSLQNSNWFKVGGVVLLAAVVVLILGVIGVTVTSNSKAESSLVDSSKLQAVFLTNDQVYFGNITTLNGKYLTLSNIYYLQTQSNGSTNKTTGSNVSLVKLGCELHKPYDKMVINRSEVEFWENLQADGQVANAVKQYQQQNPNGQKCSDTTNNSANTNNVQGSTNESSNKSNN